MHKRELRDGVLSFFGGIMAVFAFGFAVSTVQSIGSQENNDVPERGGFTFLDDGECVQGVDGKQSFMICQDGIATTRLESGYVGLERDMEITVNTRTDTVILREFNERTGAVAHTETNTLRAQSERVFIQSALTQNYALIQEAMNPAIARIADRALGFSPASFTTPYIA